MSKLQQFEHLPVVIEAVAEAATMPVREILNLQPGTMLTCGPVTAGMLTINAGGHPIGYGSLERNGGYGVRVERLTEHSR